MHSCVCSSDQEWPPSWADSCFAACPWWLEAELGNILWRGELHISRSFQTAGGEKIVENVIRLSKSNGEEWTETASVETAVW